MAGEWKRFPLGEFVTLQRGHDLPDENRQSGFVPILGSFGITGWHDKAKARGPGVTVGRSGASFGVISYSATDYWPLNTALYVVDFHGNDERFAYYFLKQFDFKAYNSGSAQPSLNRNFVHPVPVSIPPLTEQRAIAQILGTLDDKIELNRKMNATLEEMARAIFKSWFVDFEPVRAKMDGRWQRGQSLPGLPADLFDLFPDKLVDSELGEIPEEWQVGCLNDVALLLHNNINPLSFPDTNFSHFSIPAFDDNQWPRNDLGVNIKSQKSLVPPKSILLSKLNPEIERVWYVDVKTDEKAICSTELLVFLPRNAFGRSYLYSILCSIHFRSRIQGLVTGTSKSHQRAQTGSILKIKLSRAPDPLILLYEKIVSPLFERIIKGRLESRSLASLRDTLLPKLISGQIRIKDAERFLKERGL